MKARSYKCPKCGYHLLARMDNYVVCLNPDPDCGWKIESKRDEDGKLPLLSTIKEIWNG